MGHYCNVCGRIRANEKFTGKGHKKGICKDCSRMPKEKQNKMMKDIENDLSDMDILGYSDEPYNITDIIDDFYVDEELGEATEFEDDEIPF